ncbi:MAG: ERF family protein, partial [Bacteroidota bacterium]|nr:ERF family protein [Bacteroidota bacterium]
RKLAEVLQRDKKGYGYTYVGIDSILAKLSIGMRQTKLSLIPRIVPGTFEVKPFEYEKTKYDKDSKTYIDSKEMEMIVHADMVFKWVNDEDPSEFIEVPWVLSGSQADPSQALGSALTYCSRYFLLQYFQIAQPDDDPDKFRSKQKEAEEAEIKAIVSEIIKEIDNFAKEFVANATDADAAKAALLETTSKYVKGGNYKKIDNPSLATKLLSELNSLKIDQKAEEVKKGK